MDWVKVAEYVALAVGVVAGLFIGWKEWKERRVQAKGLSPNPIRCEDHEGRIRKVEAVCIEVMPRLDGLERDLTEVKAGVNRLIDLHIKN